MTLAVWNGTAADESSGNLNVLVSPTVTVTDKATGANATLASDRSGTGKSNPFTAGADGSIEFYVKPGRYKIVADDGSGNTATWDDELIGTLHGIDQPAAGEFPEYDAGNDRWVARQAGYLNPEHATDSGTDAYVSATNTTPPADGVKITRDFQSANTTTTPTLDGKTMTDRDGNALWAGAVSGPHELQYASGTDTYLVLEPKGFSGVVTPEMFGAVGDGSTDDTVAINSAIASATNGTVIQFSPAKTYLVSKDGANGWAILINRGDITLDLKSGSTILFDSGSTAANVINIGDASTNPTFARVSIVGQGKIDGNSKADHGILVEDGTGAVTDITTRDIEITGTTSNGQGAINLSSAGERTLIDSVYIHDAAEGILFGGVDYVVVRGCRVINMTAQDGIEPANSAHFWIIENNIIDTTQQQGIDIFNACDDGIVRGNIVRNTTNVGIDVSTQSTVPKRIIITDNIVEGSALQGIDGGYEETVVVSNNTVRDSGSYGITLAKNVRGNVVVNSGDHNIRVTVNNVVVSGNNIEGGTNGNSGVSVEGSASRVLVEQNTINGCSNGVNVNSSSVASIRVERNNFVSNTVNLSVTAGARAETNIRGNNGVASEASGTATISSGSTSVAVATGSDVVVGLRDFSAVPIESLGSATEFFVTDDTGNGNFKINVDADPTQDVDFAWRLDRVR